MHHDHDNDDNDDGRVVWEIYDLRVSYSLYRARESGAALQESVVVCDD